jgi:hypothetical protein
MNKQRGFKIIMMVVIGVFSLAGFTNCTEPGAVGAPPPLERGKPADLGQIDFEQADLDKLFGRLAYLKNYILGDANKKYLKEKPLVIAPYVLFNITEPRIVDRYTKRETYTVHKGELYADTVAIDRSVPLRGLKDADLRAVGYWGDKDILFNEIFTSSTKKNNLIRLRLESNELPGVTEKTYSKLISFLKAKYKDRPPKVDAQDNRPGSYQWRTNDRVIQASFNKDGNLSYMTVIISFLNPATKGLFPEFSH